jgi:retinol dehydrogenase 12
METFCSGNRPLTNLLRQALLRKNAKVYMASRSQERAEIAIANLKNETGKEAIFLQLDLSNLASVRKAAEEFKS